MKPGDLFIIIACTPVYTVWDDWKPSGRSGILDPGHVVMIIDGYHAESLPQVRYAKCLTPFGFGWVMKTKLAHDSYLEKP